jgi:hypothetical protein
MKKAIILGVIVPFLFQLCVKKNKAASYKIEMIDGVKVVRNFIEDSEEEFKNMDFNEDLSIILLKLNLMRKVTSLSWITESV